MLKKRQIVFFDLGETLIRMKQNILMDLALIILMLLRLPPTSAYKESLAAWLKKIEIDEWNETPPERISVIQTISDERTFLVGFYARVLSRLGIEQPQDYLCEFMADQAINPANYELFPDAEATIKSLVEKGFELGIISNALPSGKVIVESLGLDQLFSFCIYSFECSSLKPQAGIYLHALDVAQASYPGNEDVFFIDDRPHFVQAAEAPNVGMSGILLDRQMQYNCISEVKRVTMLDQSIFSLPAVDTFA